MVISTFAEAAAVTDRLIALLARNDVTPAIGVRVETELLSPLDVMERARHGRPQDLPVDLLAAAGGMYDLAAKIVAISQEPEFESFKPHLQLFAKPHLYTSALQSSAGHPNNDAGRKLVELYVGALAVHFAHDVTLDHPVSSAGDNPDVMCTIEDQNGHRVRWAIAVKNISSRVG